MTTTVSAKIPDEMKEELDREEVSVSEVIREALDEELKRRRRERLRHDVAALRDRIDDGASTAQIVETVRETREER